jgi:predicted MFS family arabinose efflux permease
VIAALLTEKSASVPRSDASEAVPLAGFLGGVLLSQVVNGALHLAQPLLIARLAAGSLGTAAFFSSFDTAVHMGGSLLGGRPADRFGARRVLIASTFLRGLSLALIPLLWLAGRLTLAAAMAAYTLDALVRGLTDTAAHSLPLELGGRDRAALDRVNARYELVFDLGAAAGPLALGALYLKKEGLAPHALVPAGFLLAALVFVAIPRRARLSFGASRAALPGTAPAGSWQGVRAICSDRSLLLAALGVAVLNLYPLRKLIAAFFAKAILVQPAAAGWIGGAFGVGGALGALIYARSRGKGSGAAWVAAGGVGVLALATAWIPGRLTPMLAAAFLFALANVGARLALTRRMQERTPQGLVGATTGAARFAANGVSVLMKALVGAAFALGAGPRAAFAAVGVGLGALALAQFSLARRLSETAQSQ